MPESAPTMAGRWAVLAVYAATVGLFLWTTLQVHAAAHGQQMHAAAPPPSSRAATAVAERDRHREKAERPEPRVV